MPETAIIPAAPFRHPNSSPERGGEPDGTGVSPPIRSGEGVGGRGEGIDPHTHASPWPPRIIHGLATLTALVALPLLFFGAWVTTIKAGMVDPVWPTVPWFLLHSGAWDHGLGFVIEHGHRAFGYAVGTCGILLLIAVLRWESRPYVRWMTGLGLLGICVQGVLGGLRVDLISTQLALVHGCFGQLVFSVLVSVALATSARWSADDRDFPAATTAPLRRASLLLTGLLLCQLVAGAMIRHLDSGLGQRLHVLNAFAVVAALCWLVQVVRESHRFAPRMTGAVVLLVGLTIAQLMLGVETWMVKFAGSATVNPTHPLFNRDLVRTLHVLTGSLILAASVVVTLEAHRRTAWTAVRTEAAPADRLEGVA
jgi:cytochrome c oxidase assembly protein subunit 15